jgi:hypothetical protein
VLHTHWNRIQAFRLHKWHCQSNWHNLQHQEFPSHRRMRIPIETGLTTLFVVSSSCVDQQQTVLSKSQSNVMGGTLQIRVYLDLSQCIQTEHRVLKKSAVRVLGHAICHGSQLMKQAQLLGPTQHDFRGSASPRATGNLCSSQVV